MILRRNKTSTGQDAIYVIRINCLLFVNKTYTGRYECIFITVYRHILYELDIVLYSNDVRVCYISLVMNHSSCMSDFSPLFQVLLIV